MYAVLPTRSAFSPSPAVPRAAAGGDRHTVTSLASASSTNPTLARKFSRRQPPPVNVHAEALTAPFTAGVSPASAASSSRGQPNPLAEAGIALPWHSQKAAFRVVPSPLSSDAKHAPMWDSNDDDDEGEQGGDAAATPTGTHWQSASAGWMTPNAKRRQQQQQQQQPKHQQHRTSYTRGDRTSRSAAAGGRPKLPTHSNTARRATLGADVRRLRQIESMQHLGRSASGTPSLWSDRGSHVSASASVRQSPAPGAASPQLHVDTGGQQFTFDAPGRRSPDPELTLEQLRRTAVWADWQAKERALGARELPPTPAQAQQLHSAPSAAALDDPFSYRLPQDLELEPGSQSIRRHLPRSATANSSTFAAYSSPHESPAHASKREGGGDADGGDVGQPVAEQSSTTFYGVPTQSGSTWRAVVAPPRPVTAGTSRTLTKTRRELPQRRHSSNPAGPHAPYLRASLRRRQQEFQRSLQRKAQRMPPRPRSGGPVGRHSWSQRRRHQPQHQQQHQQQRPASTTAAVTRRHRGSRGVVGLVQSLINLSHTHTGRQAASRKAEREEALAVTQRMRAARDEEEQRRQAEAETTARKQQRHSTHSSRPRQASATTRASVLSDDWWDRPHAQDPAGVLSDSSTSAYSVASSGSSAAADGDRRHTRTTPRDTPRRHRRRGSQGTRHSARSRRSGRSHHSRRHSRASSASQRAGYSSDVEVGNDAAEDEAHTAVVQQDTNDDRDGSASGKPHTHQVLRRWRRLSESRWHEVDPAAPEPPNFEAIEAADPMAVHTGKRKRTWKSVLQKLRQPSREQLQLDLEPAIRHRDTVPEAKQLADGTLLRSPPRAPPEAPDLTQLMMDALVFRDGAESCTGRVEGIEQYKEPQLRTAGMRAGASDFWKHLPDSPRSTVDCQWLTQPERNTITRRSERKAVPNLSDCVAWMNSFVTEEVQAAPCHCLCGDAC